MSGSGADDGGESCSCSWKRLALVAFTFALDEDVVVAAAVVEDDIDAVGAVVVVEVAAQDSCSPFRIALICICSKSWAKAAASLLASHLAEESTREDGRRTCSNSCESVE